MQNFFRNKNFIRVLAIVALVAFVGVSILISIPSFASPSVSEAQRQQQEAKAKKENAENQRSAELQRREELDRQISTVQGEIDSYQAEIDKKAKMIEESEAEIRILTHDLQAQNSSYNERAKNLIKKGDASYTEIILNSKSMDDFLTRSMVLKRVAKYDSEKMKEIEDSMGEVEVLKNNLTAQKEEVIGIKAKVDEKKKELDGYREESQQIIDNLQKDIEAFEREYEMARQAEEQARAEAERLRKEAEAKASQGVPQSGNAYYTPPANTSGPFMWPTPSTRLITSPYGYRVHPITGRSRLHAGVDIGARYGADIVAAKSGTVIVAGYNRGGYGNYVVINHGGGYSTLYGHCSSLLVSAGQTVSQGQVIAKCGSTGASTGPHVHFEVHYNGQTTNPMQYFR